MKMLSLALAATSLLATPAVAAQSNGNGNGNGNAFGKGPRVCLITFNRDTTVGLPAEDVVKAQFLPLGVALRKDTTASLIVTYGANGATGDGIDIARVQYNDPSVSGITTSSTTEQACTALAEFAESRSMDMDDDD